MGRGNGAAHSYLRVTLAHRRGLVRGVLARWNARAVRQPGHDTEAMDAGTGRLIRTFEGHFDSVISVAFSSTLVTLRRAAVTRLSDSGTLPPASCCQRWSVGGRVNGSRLRAPVSLAARPKARKC